MNEVAFLSAAWKLPAWLSVRSRLFSGGELPALITIAVSPFHRSPPAVAPWTFSLSAARHVSDHYHVWAFVLGVSKLDAHHQRYLTAGERVSSVTTGVS